MNSLLQTYGFEGFSFLRPQMLWLLIPIIVLYIIYLFKSNEKAKWQNIIPDHLKPWVISPGNEKLLKFWMTILAFSLMLAVVGLAGPTWRNYKSPDKTVESPLLIILKNNASMLEEDILPNRLERAKYKINDLLDLNPGANIALICYSGSAHTVVPLTHDYQIIISNLKSLKPEIMPIEGNEPEEAFKLADTILIANAAPARILFIADYFGNSETEIIENYLKTHNAKMEIMPVYNSSKGDKISINNLSKLSKKSSVIINNLTLDNSDMQLLAKRIKDNLSFTEIGEEQDRRIDDGLWFIIPFAIMLLMMFRKGFVFYSFTALLLFSSCSEDFHFNDLWLSRDYQAQTLMDKGNFEEAAELYKEPLHKGIAYFKAGNYEKAIAEFEKDSSELSMYNLGLAYYKNGNYRAGLSVFEHINSTDSSLVNKEMISELNKIIDAQNEAQISDANATEESEQNIENKDMEDLSGGGQEAKEEDMKKERKEETVTTEMRKGKELDEVPENFQSGSDKIPPNIIMAKVDDDPALFLKRKFKFQVKKK